MEHIATYAAFLLAAISLSISIVMRPKVEELEEELETTSFIPAKRISVVHWRKTPARVDAAREMAKVAIFQEMLCAVENSRPEGFVPGVEVSNNQAVRELGRIEGYGECLQNIRFLCSDPKELQTMPEPDYGAGERPK